MAKIKRVSRRLMVLSSAVAGALGGLFGSQMPQANATAYWWDNSPGAGFGTAGGTWSSSGGEWAANDSDGSGTANTSTVTTNTDDVHFDSAATGGVVIGAGAVARSVTFDTNVVMAMQNAGSGSLTIGGTGGSSGIFVAAGDNATTTFNAQVTLILGADATFQNAGTGLLNMTNTQNGGLTGAHNLTVQSDSTGGITLATVNIGGTITNSGTGTGTVTLGGVIGTNVSGVTQNSSTSLLLLSGANTYTGPTTVMAGTLQAGVSGAFGNNSAVTLSNVAGVTLDLNSKNTQIGSLDGGGTTGGIVTLGSATLTLGGTSISSSFAGVISGTGGLTMNATGTETLTGANTYTGATSVSAGTMILNGSNGTLTNTSSLTISNVGIFDNGDATNGAANRIKTSIGLTFGTGGGTFATVLGSATANSQSFTTLTLGAGTSFVTTTGSGGTSPTVTFSAAAASVYPRLVGQFVDLDNSAQTIAFAHAPSGTGSVAGSLLVGAALQGNDFVSDAGGAIAGPTHVPDTFATSNNTDVTMSDSPASAAGANSLRFTTGSPTLTFTGSNTITSGGILVESGAVNPTITGGSITTTRDLWMYINSGTALTVNSSITGSSTSTLSFGGGGTLTLGGSNTYAGGLTLTSGTLNANNPYALGTGTITINGSVNSNPTIDNTTLMAETLSSNNPVAITSNFTFGGTNDLNLGTGAVTDNGSYTITLNGTASTLAMGVLTNTASTQTITVNGAANTLVLAGYNLSSNGTARTDTIAGSGNVTITGPVTNSTTGGVTGSGITFNSTGTLTLSASNSYTGTTTIKFPPGLTGPYPTVVLTNVNAAGTGAFSITTSDADKPDGDPHATIALHINGTGTITMPNTIGSSSGVTTTIDVNNNTPGSSAGGSNVVVEITSAGLGSTNVLNVTGGNGYSLLIDSLADSGGAAGNITVNPTTASVSIGSLSNAHGTGTDTWTLDGINTGNAVTGVISNGTGTNKAAVTKSNTSTWTLSGSNTYTGATTVSAGTLVVNGSLNSSSNVSIADGAVLSGTGNGSSTGIIFGSVTLAHGTSGPTSSGGRISPGSGGTSSDTVGKLTLANGTNTFGTGGGATQVTYDWKVASVGGTVGTAGANFDTLAVTGLSINGTGGVDVVAIPLTTPAFSATGFNSASTYKWDILTGTESGGSIAVGNLYAQFHLDTTGLHGFETALGLSSSYDSSFSIVNDGGAVAVQYQYAGAPEPTSMMLLGVGVGGMALRRRRRGQAKATGESSK